MFRMELVSDLFEKNTNLKCQKWTMISSIFNSREFKGTGSRLSACSFIKMLFYCRDMLYRQCKQYDHVIMLSKNQSALSPSWQSLALDQLKSLQIAVN